MIKSKKKGKNRSNADNTEVADPWEDQKQYGEATTTGEFTAGELGQPDDDADQLDRKNPQAVQSGRGPLDQEGEGNRQNDELAELQQEVPLGDAHDKT
jgi:hypothetical protein